MSKQAAVDWLVKELNQKIDFIPMKYWDEIRDIVKQAKAMEREQIEEAVDSVQLVNRRYYRDGTFADDEAGEEIQLIGREYIGLSKKGKQYYEQTYGGNK